MTKRLFSGQDIVLLAEGLISAKKQQGPTWLDLTVRRLARVRHGGSLDFGGSEYQTARLEPLTPEKKAPEENYGWWNLQEGTYLIQFNEKLRLAEGSLVLIVPHERLLGAGCSHGTAVLAGLDESVAIPIQVGSGGLAIKENARVSKALVMEPA